MGFNFHIDKEDLDRMEKKKGRLKGSISYRADDSLEIPDLEMNFTPQTLKNSKPIKSEEVDLKKNKNKSNKLI